MSKETADVVEDAIVRHRVLLERFSASEVKSLTPLLDQVSEDILSKLRKRLEKLSDTDGRVVGSTARRLAELRDEISGISQAAKGEIQTTVRQTLVDLAAEEISFADKLYKGVGLADTFVRPNADQLRSIVVSKPFEGRLLREWTSGWKKGLDDRVMGQIKIGMVSGESVDSIVRRIQGTRAAKYKDGILETSRRGAEALVRTAVNHVSNQAHASFLEANKKIFKRYRWQSALDGRTTPVCRSRAGKIYKHGDGPLPPAHIRCRSTITPVIEGEGERSELRYDKWLRKQDAADQDDILGATRGKLFREGKLPIDKFTNRKGDQISLAQLRDKEADAFYKAGLGPKPAAPKPKPAAPKSTSSFSTEVRGKKREFTSEGGRPDHTEVLVDVRKLDDAWSVGDERVGSRSQIGTRRTEFREFLDKNPETPIRMSEIGSLKPSLVYENGEPVKLPDGTFKVIAVPEFEDGRHRFSVLRDEGLDAVPVMVSNDIVKDFRELYGYKKPEKPVRQR